MKQLFCIWCWMFISCAQSQTASTETISDTLATINKDTQIVSTINNLKIPESKDENFLRSYKELREQINTNRIKFYQDYVNATTQDQKKNCLDSTSNYLHHTLVETIFPYWYGTVWDFNGISDQPQHGKIACGYFLSTTLKHTSFVLNRYKLAQQYSHSIVNSLGSDVKRFTTITSMLTYVESQPNNLYVVGLDNHVGFISKENLSIQFIHSTFVGASCVESEEAHASAVLGSSRVYVLGNITRNAQLIINWLEGAPVEIVP